MNDGISICRYRGILQPSADSNQRDASQVFISLITKQWNSTTSALEFYHIKLLAECGVCKFFLYSFCHYMIRNDLKTISQYQKFTKFWKWSAACVIIRIKGTGSFVPPSLANWSFVFRWSISRSSPAKTIEKKKKKERKNYDKSKADGVICVQ